MSTQDSWWRDRDWVLSLIKHLEQLVANIINGGGLNYTVHNIAAGQTYSVLTTDRYLQMATDGTHGTATANLPAPTYIGEQHTFFWEFWDVSEVPPVINATAGKTLVPFSGLASSGGTTASTTISTPGATYTLMGTG